jgi:hypothetical protein
MTGQQSSAAPLAPVRGTPSPVSRRWAAVRALIFAAGLIAGFASSRILLDSPPIATSSGASTVADQGATDADAYMAYRQTVANVIAAVGRGDTASMARYRQAVADQATASMVGAAHDDYARLVAKIAAAEQGGDAQMLAVLRSRLAELCPRVDTGFAPSFCQ